MAHVPRARGWRLHSGQRSLVLTAQRGDRHGVSTEGQGRWTHLSLLIPWRAQPSTDAWQVPSCLCLSLPPPSQGQGQSITTVPASPREPFCPQETVSKARRHLLSWLGHCMEWTELGDAVMPDGTHHRAWSSSKHPRGGLGKPSREQAVFNFNPQSSHLGAMLK
jgi:hypothetical protein